MSEEDIKFRLTIYAAVAELVDALA
jgi:hypothetical protein